MIDFEMITACGKCCYGCTKKTIPAIAWTTGKENFEK
jgi:hypothetical protein